MLKKYCLFTAAVLGMALTLTACRGNIGADTSDGIVDMQIDNQVDMQEENWIDIQTENQNNTQVEEQVDIQKENEADSRENDEPAADDIESENEEETGGNTEMKINVQIGDYNFTATLQDNEAVKELVDMMKEEPITISMNDYSGFEKVGSLGRSLTTNNCQTTTNAGDIVLYNGDSIVMFYGSNSWSYTRIGKIDDLSNWEKALGKGSITVVFTLVE